jgi:hypothetical protein
VLGALLKGSLSPKTARFVGGPSVLRSRKTHYGKFTRSSMFVMLVNACWWNGPV